MNLVYAERPLRRPVADRLGEGGQLRQRRRLPAGAVAVELEGAARDRRAVHSRGPEAPPPRLRRELPGDRGGYFTTAVQHERAALCEAEQPRLALATRARAAS